LSCIDDTFSSVGVREEAPAAYESSRRRLSD
jgi:hypothetical protein